MSEPISRREFLKLSALGLGASAVLSGCGTAARYVTRQPYGEMPEYSQTGNSVYFATSCGECSAGCGLIVRTMEGRAHKVDGNPVHPVNREGTCSRGQATLQGVYNPDRIQAPGKQPQRGSGKFDPLDWEAAVTLVKDALQNNPSNQVAFLLGLFPDHLHDLVQMISSGLGGAKVLRYATLGEFDKRDTLIQAANKMFAVSKIPGFDVENGEMIFSFGANFLETWLSPIAYSFGYGMMRQGHQGQRGYLVQFESRMSQTAANADEWYPIKPGSELILAQGLGRLVSELKFGRPPAAYANVDIQAVVEKTGILETDLRRLAALFASSPAPLAIPGGVPLGYTNGQAAAESILALNILVDNLGKDGGIFFLPDTPIYPDIPNQPSSYAEISALVEAMQAGQIKVLFVHGVNPIYDLPQSLGFRQALEKVPQVISFASFPDETAAQADYVLPDNTPLESWGYQKIMVGSDRSTISGLQPVVVPLYDTRPTADVFLAAVQQIGGELAAAVPFTDEANFIQKSVAVLIDQGGFYTAPTPGAFFVLWQQYGGWWKAQADRIAPSAAFTLDQALDSSAPTFIGDVSAYPMFFIPFPNPNLGDGSAANRPTLQEAPDPMTTVMWNTWVELNPATALALGVKSDDIVKITSPAGEVEAIIYEYPGINPEVVAITLGQGHTAFGRYAKGRGINPQDLLANQQTDTGSLACMATRVQITPTGKHQTLARYESKEGVYGAWSYSKGA